MSRLVAAVILLVAVSLSACLGAPPPTPTPVPTATPEPASESVKEGCVASAVLKTMTVEMDIDGLDRMGPQLMTAMVTTDDQILNLTGALTADAMTTFSENATAANLDRMIDGFDAYIETCQNLMR